MNRLRGGLNRAALACVGIPLATAGTVLGADGVLGRGRLPSWWPVFASGSVWVDRGTLASWQDHNWWTPLAATALGVALLLCLYWCALQVRGGRVRILPFSRDDITLSGFALSDAVERRTRALPGVMRARVHLLGRPTRLRLRVHVVLAPGASPAAVLSHFSTRTLAEAREVTARRIDAEVRMQTRRHRSRRVH
ncbi:alkaline shock response membrane anchor protein AmaP [Streptomyces sp. AK02-04a]|uniref:alkaline shock response membrane anchor protein AmaP n=1 Tax=Streptomyces sp. AK02-04a TaxID=3028649 RepID=UPI0029A6BF8B|nr:alkaline shock response membrane anchor protein AmaP [Streptomyces sp. AK02-04a]MDX3763402.1 alkaline shock response membrane anchor protein AmaP [Streptomyces sp. AK02-04a]